MKKFFAIAEAGVNYNGSLNLAKKLILNVLLAHLFLYVIRLLIELEYHPQKQVH